MKDRIFPTQNFNKNLYNGNDELLVLAIHDLLDRFSPANEFKLVSHHRVGFEEMSTPPVQLSLIKMLISLTVAKRALEIGTFIGNTALHMNKFMGSGEVITIEKFSEFSEIAEINIKNNGAKNITVLLAEASEALKQEGLGKFDLIYIDADKGNYLKLAKLSEGLLSENGIIVVDDVFFHGDVFNTIQRTDKGFGCKLLLDHYESNDSWEKCLLPLGNGMLVLYRK